jgi:hypothetical protein
LSIVHSQRSILAGPIRPLTALAADPQPQTISERLLLLGWPARMQNAECRMQNVALMATTCATRNVDRLHAITIVGGRPRRGDPEARRRRTQWPVIPEDALLRVRSPFQCGIYCTGAAAAAGPTDRIPTRSGEKVYM